MIGPFKGKYQFLSNFVECPLGIRFEGETYRSVEHAYQAAKTLDLKERVQFRHPALTAGSARRLGRKVTLRPDWDAVKLDVMRALLREKFSDLAFAALLLETGDEEIVEQNYWRDYFWGVCNGRGENWLGKLLMEIRAELRKAGL